MPKVFMVRHQKAGIVTSHVFASTPTPAQVAPIVEECERLHGQGGWVLIHEAELLGAGSQPVFSKPAADPPKPFKVEGKGSVETK